MTTKLLMSAFIVGDCQLFITPFPRSLPLSHSLQHTIFRSTRMKILQLRKQLGVIRSGASAAPQYTVNNQPPVKTDHVDQKLVSLTVTALVTIRNNEMGNLMEMMPQLMLNASNPKQLGGHVVLQLVSRTEIDPSNYKDHFLICFIYVFL